MPPVQTNIFSNPPDDSGDDSQINKSQPNQEDSALAQKVEEFQLPDEQLAALAKIRVPPQWWYETDESLF